MHKKFYSLLLLCTTLIILFYIFLCLKNISFVFKCSVSVKSLTFYIFLYCWFLYFKILIMLKINYLYCSYRIQFMSLPTHTHTVISSVELLLTHIIFYQLKKVELLLTHIIFQIIIITFRKILNGSEINIIIFFYYKLQQEYEKCGLQINTHKTQYSCIYALVKKQQI